MTSKWNEGVSIVIPTYKRPDGIKGALESLEGSSAGDRLLEIVVADNDPNASARDYVCLLYTSPSPRDGLLSRMPSSA